MSYRHKNRLRAWILDPEADKNNIVRFIAESVKELDDQYRHWTRLTGYITELRQEANAARIHEQKLSYLQGDVEDLKDVLLEFGSFSSQLQAIERFEGQLKSFHTKVGEISNFVDRLERNLIPALSLSVDLEEETGLLGLEHEFANLKYRIPGDMDDLKIHPAVQWVDKKLETAKKHREDIEQTLIWISEAYELDRIYGANVQKAASTEEIDTFSQERRTVVEQFMRYLQDHPDATWMEWAFAKLQSLEREDPKNLTNWKEAISYGDLKSISKVKAYFTEITEGEDMEGELENLRKVSGAIVKCEEIQLLAFDDAYFENMKAGNFDEALNLYIVWMGHPLQSLLKEKQDEEHESPDFQNVVSELLGELSDLKEWTYVEKLINQRISHGIQFPNPSMYSWCRDRIVAFKQVPAPDEKKASRWYRDLYDQLKPYVIDVEKIISDANECLQSLQEKKRLWDRTWHEIEACEQDWIKAVSKPFWRRIFLKTETEKQKGQLRTMLYQAYQIAPDHSEIKRKIQDYGFSIPDVENLPEIEWEYNCPLVAYEMSTPLEN